MALVKNIFIQLQRAASAIYCKIGRALALLLCWEKIVTDEENTHGEVHHGLL